METRFEPQRLESEIYRRWEEGGAFSPRGDGKPFVLMMPPPNVTGNLHVGHALTFSIQDVLVRFHRMLGESTLYQPGSDHAGIGTQTLVERQIRKEGLNRETMGREAFLERVWEWREKYGGEILGQLRRLGISAAWGRLKFTLDPDLSKAVREAFVRDYERGLIYRGPYIVNWCPSCGTAISDLEVAHREDPGTLWTLRYPLADGSGDVLVATTRPETMLGDTAVAVHPEDPRHQAKVGKKVRLPILDQEIPVVADTMVDREFGTGAVKVTPAHDPNDFATALRHHLPKPQVIDQAGKMVNVPARYLGLTTLDARKKIVEELEARGFLEEAKDNPHNVGHCDRCDTVVEPLLSEQWFVKTAPMAEKALEALRDGRLSLYPERFDKIFTHWMENIRDWCISRQIWWGHRIPAFYCDACRQVTVSREDPDRCPHCQSPSLHQDEDVLDTWYSSALWPFSTLGWPEQTPDLKRYFPGSVLVTGYDILFFWVARMVMQSLDLTGEVPFRDVVLHGLVRDKDGKKMSKSRGNVVDPLKDMDAHGSDALRWALLTGTTPGQDVRYAADKVIEGRNFANKVWNAGRFVIMSTEGKDGRAALADRPLDRWLKDRLAEAVEKVRGALLAYELGEAARAAQDFFWGDFCDVFLEAAKPRLLTDEGDAVASLLQKTLADGLGLLHPFIPFVTEAVWQEAPWTDGQLMGSPWPSADFSYPTERQEVDALLELVRVARNLKAEAGVPGTRKVGLRIVPQPRLRGLLETESAFFETLTSTELSFTIDEGEKAASLSGRTADGDVFLPLGGAVDVAAEKGRVAKELQDLRAEIERMMARLDSPGFRDRAPQEVVSKEEARLAATRDQEDRARARQRALDALKQ